jgi:hypothetical protein
MAGTLSPEKSAGAVFVRFGSADGGIASAWRQMMLSQTGAQHEDLWDNAEEGDNVGMSVAAGSVGAGGAADLMISVPGERFPNLTLGEPLGEPYDQMFVDGMTHVVYGQEGVGLDGDVGENPWFPRFTRGAQIDPRHVQFDLFQEVMQETQPIVSENWSLTYSYVELLLKPWTDPALGTADELYTRVTYQHHGGRELGPRFREVEGFGVFVIDGSGVMLIVDAYYEDFGHRRAARFLPMFPDLALWAEPVQVLLLPNYAVEVIVEP